MNHQLKDILGFIAILSLYILVRKINNKLFLPAGLIAIGSVVYITTNSVHDTIIALAMFLFVDYFPTILNVLTGKTVEGFDGEKEAEEGEEDVVALIEKLETDLDHAKKHNKLSKEDEDKLDQSKELNEDDETRVKKEKKNKDKPASEHTPASAQRETFRLIDSVKQLDDTIKNLAPTLKQGNKVMEAFKKLAFRDEKK